MWPKLNPGNHCLALLGQCHLDWCGIYYKRDLHIRYNRYNMMWWIQVIEKHIVTQILRLGNGCKRFWRTRKLIVLIQLYNLLNINLFHSSFYFYARVMVVELLSVPLTLPNYRSWIIKYILKVTKNILTIKAAVSIDRMLTASSEIESVVMNQYCNNSSTILRRMWLWKIHCNLSFL